MSESGIFENFEDFLKSVDLTNTDATYSVKEFPGGFSEHLEIKSPKEMPPDAPKLPKVKSSPVKKIDYVTLPPKEQFVYSLRYLMDLAKATKVERATLEKLIKRFENDGQSEKTG